MTLYDAVGSFGRADDMRSDVVPSQITTGLLEAADEFAKKFAESSWKTIVVVLLLLTSLFAAEWFVTYCGFSNRCPIVQRVAELPASKLQVLPVL